jgi:hypothetical protein
MCLNPTTAQLEVDKKEDQQGRSENHYYYALPDYYALPAKS